MIFKNSKVYDIIKDFAYILAAVETLWLALGEIWNFPYTAQIGASIAAVQAFLLALLKISSVQYNKMLKEEEEAKEIMNGDA